MIEKDAGPGGAPAFILYSRSWCHLCEDMLAALQAMAPPDSPFEVDVIDVDADPALLVRFDELVPVLYTRDRTGGEGRQLCHYFLDRDAVADAVADAVSDAVADAVSDAASHAVPRRRAAGA